MEKKENRLVVGDSSWAETIPKWLLKEIESERFVDCACSLLGKNRSEEKASDAECVAYLMPASMRAPLHSEYVNIYLYLSAKVMLKAKRFESEDKLPDFVKETYKKGLTDYEQQLLNELKSDIGRKRGKVKHPIFEALREVFKESKKEKRKQRARGRATSPLSLSHSTIERR